MKKRVFTAILIALVMTVGFALVACEDNPSPPNPTTYTVTFVGGADATGTAPTIAAQEEGATFALPSNTFAKTGFTFANWNDGTTDYAVGATYTMGAANVTFTATWIKDPEPTYTITFVGGADATGTAPTLAAQEEGATFALPENTFAKTGFTFAMWNDGTTDYAVGATYTMGAANVTFTATWIKDPEPTYTITFVGGADATGTAPTLAAKEEGATFALPSNTFVKTGYTFAMWNDGTTDYAVGATYTMGAANVTFTATWTNDLEAPYFTKPFNGRILADTQDGKYSGNIVLNANGTGSIYLELVSSSVTLMSADITGYTIIGNTITLNGNSEETTFPIVGTIEGRTVRIEVKYQYFGANTAVFTSELYGFTMNYGEAMNNEVVTSYLPLGDQALLSLDSVSGYEHTGWIGEDQVEYAVTDVYTVVNKDYSMTAKWQVKATQYTVTLKPGDGVTGINDYVKAVPIKPIGNTTFSLSIGAYAVENTYGFKREGYKVVEWVDENGNTQAAGTIKLTSDRTFTAVWAATEVKYTVTLELDFGIIFNEPDYSVTSGANFVLPFADYKTASRNPYVTKDGFALLGWKKDNAGDLIAPGTSVTVTANASYTAIYGYSIAFAVIEDDATGTKPDKAFVEVGATYIIPNSDLARPGYIFDGWLDGVGNLHKIGASITVTANMECTAMWLEDPDAVKYAVSFVGGAGSTGDAPIVDQQLVGAIFALPINTFIKDGFIFDGWNDGTTVYAAGATYTMPNAAVTFTAEWKAESTGGDVATSVSDYIDKTFSGMEFSHILIKISSITVNADSTISFGTNKGIKIYKYQQIDGDASNTIRVFYNNVEDLADTWKFVFDFSTNEVTITTTNDLDYTFTLQA